MYTINSNCLPIWSSTDVEEFLRPLKKILNPTYDLIQESDNCFKLQIPLAGFKKSEISVYSELGNLYVSATKSSDEQKYIYRGNANGSFIKVWRLIEHTSIKSVDYENGLLIIKLIKDIPESHKKVIYF
jgi:molecular chaperone IbpA